MNFIKSFWKTITWALVVLLLSAISGDTVQDMGRFFIPHFDKLVHFGMYFMFTFLMINDFIRSYGTAYSTRQIILFCILFAMVYGGVMEFLQSVPKLHRSKDFYDFISNSIGAITAGAFYKQWMMLINWFWFIVIKQEKNYSL